MTDLTVTHEFNLVSNMEDVKASIAETIAKYDVVVSEDRIGEAKELMATFNKDKKEFSATCKKFIDTISEPITQFKASQKEIEKMYDDGRTKIADQVTKFEVTKLAEIKEAVRLFRDAICCEKNIHPDSVVVDDLVMLSAVTSGINLSKKTKESIDARIQAVENEILKARLEMEEKAEREKFQAVENERLRAKNEELLKPKTGSQSTIPTGISDEENEGLNGNRPNIDKKDEDGKITHVIYARFEVPAPVGIDPQRIVSKIKSLIENAGITSLKSIEVQ